MFFCSMVKPTPPVSLKEDDFPSLVHSGTVGSAPMTPAYTVQARKPSFQEEDFPALVSRIRPPKPQENPTSAWSQVGSKPGVLNNKPVVLPTKTYSHSAPVFSASDPPPSSTVPQAHASRRKKKLTSSSQSTKATSKVRSPVSSDDEDPESGKMVQEIRAVPTMLDISSLLTVKTSSLQPNNKNGKKRQPSSTPSGMSANNVELVTTAAHKENVPETKPPDGSVSKGTTVPKSNMFINGYKKETKNTILPDDPPAPKKQPVSEPPAVPEEEDFPALVTKKPPPGRTLSSFCIET